MITRLIGETLPQMNGQFLLKRLQLLLGYSSEMQYLNNISSNASYNPQQRFLNVLQFCPRRVYCCPCLLVTINFFKKITRTNSVKCWLTVLLKLRVEFPPVVSVRVDDKELSFFICSAHLHQILSNETTYSCTSNDVQFPEPGKTCF